MAERESPAAGAEKSRMKDVARLAGVSLMTVSRALRQPERVAPATLERIHDAMRACDYVPDLAAASLASRRSGFVAMIVPTVANSIFTDTIAGVSDTLQPKGLQLLVGASGYSVGLEEQLVRACLGRRSDGVILVGVEHSETTRRLLKRAGVPVVEAWDLSAEPLDSQVGFSNYRAAYAMTEQLLAAGYRRIGFIGGATGERRAAERRRAYCEALAEHGGRAPLVEETGDWTAMASGARALVRLREREPALDAVFCLNDALAAGALFECQRRGWQVPGELAIAGFGDFEFAGEVHPALTTVRVPRRAIGERSADLLLRQLGGETHSGQRLDLGFEIVRRASA